MNKSVLYLSTRIFWPTNAGKKITSFFNTKGMSEDYQYDVHLYTFLEKGQNYEESLKPSFIKSVEVAKNPNFFEILFNIIFKTWFGKFSYQSSLYFRRSNGERLKQIINELKPDIVIVDMIRLSRYQKYLKTFSGIKVICLDDLLSLRYERQLKEVTSKTDIGGQFTKQSKGLVKRILGFNWLKRLVLKSESKKVRKEELLTANWYDYAYFVSEKETQLYNEFTHTSKGVTITMGVDVNYFSEYQKIQKIPNSVSFVGNYYYSPNIDSLTYILDQVLPHAKEKVVVYAIGPISDDIKSLFSKYNNIVFTHEVADLREHVKACELSLVPIAYGTGIKTKVVEALAMGMPVITNSLGVEGLSVQNGVHLICEDDPQRIASAIDMLLMNKDRQEALGKQAEKFAKEKHDWHLIWKDLEKIGFKKD